MKAYYIALVLVFGLALAGCHWGRYSATAQVQFRPRGFPLITSLGDHGDSFDSATEIGMLENDEVLLPVVHNLNLSQIWAHRFKSDRAVWTNQETLDHFRKVLKFESQPGTPTIKIIVSSEVPQEAADIANGLADQYKAMRDDEETQRTQRGLNALREQITQEQNALDNAKEVVSKAHNDAQREVGQSVETKAQSMLDALNVRLRQITEDSKLTESPVRIISRAVAPPE